MARGCLAALHWVVGRLCGLVVGWRPLWLSIGVARSPRHVATASSCSRTSVLNVAYESRMSIVTYLETVQIKNRNCVDTFRLDAAASA